MNAAELKVIPVAASQPDGMGKNLVLLHGWGSNAEDLASLQDYFEHQSWNLYCLNGIFPHPHAPGGWMWYDLDRPDWPGLDQSREVVLAWMHGLEARSGVPLSRTVIGGFSQGAAMSLDLATVLPVAGVMVLSGYLHPHLSLEALGDPPPQVLMVHGRQDTIVPIETGRKVHHFLQTAPKPLTLTYEEMDAGHEVNLQGLKAIERFLAQVL